MRISIVKYPLIFTTASIIAAQTNAAEISAAIGQTSQSQQTRRLSIEAPWENKALGIFDGYWDTGLTYWEKGDKAPDRWSVSFAPVFVYEFQGTSITPYIEAGIGLAAFSGTTVGDRNLGSSVHFEDRMGFGIKFRETTKIGFRAIHYSNAGLKQPNAGIESFSIFATMQL